MRIKVKDGGITHRLLTNPTLSEVDVYFGEQSRLTYVPDEERSNRVRLTPLGVLNGLFNVELQLKEPEELTSLDSSSEDRTTPT